MESTTRGKRALKGGCKRESEDTRLHDDQTQAGQEIPFKIAQASRVMWAAHPLVREIGASREQL